MTIDLTRSNYTKKLALDGLFKREAFKKFIDIAISTANDPVFDEEEIKKIAQSRVDNTICLSGERGSGKTFFIYNLEHLYHKSNKSTTDEVFKNSKALVFLPLLDTTLLHKKEDFLWILVSHIAHYTEDRFGNGCDSTEEKVNCYHKTLKNVTKCFKSRDSWDDSEGLKKSI